MPERADESMDTTDADGAKNEMSYLETIEDVNRADNRRCKKCFEEKPLTKEFWKLHSTGTWGWICRACKVQQHREYNAKTAKQRSEYEKANRERRNQQKRAWRAVNRDRIRQYNRKYRLKRRAAKKAANE